MLAVTQMNYSGEIKSLDDLDSVTKAAQQDHPLKTNGSFQDAYQYFRGHELTKYTLRASLPRMIQNLDKLIEFEKKLIPELKCWTKVLFLNKLFHQPSNTIEFHNNWYWLTQIQHEEIPTRLLDWTEDSKIALYFAVNNPMFHNEDGDFWIFFVKDTFNLSTQNQESTDPISIVQDWFVSIPVQWNANFQDNEAQRRILGQQGKFFIRSKSNVFTPLEKDSKYIPFLKRYKVPKVCKVKILQALNNENYTDKTVYKLHNIRMKIIKKIIEKRLFA